LSLYFGQRTADGGVAYGSPTFLSAADGSRAVVAADFNFDGKADIATANGAFSIGQTELNVCRRGHARALQKNVY
jgi:hypothetical protein